MYGETIPLSTSIGPGPRSEPEPRRRLTDVRQNRVDVGGCGLVVEDSESKKYRLTNNDVGKPSETPPFDLLLNAVLHSVQPRAHNRRRASHPRHPARPPGHVAEADAG